MRATLLLDKNIGQNNEVIGNLGGFRLRNYLLSQVIQGGIQRAISKLLVSGTSYQPRCSITNPSSESDLMDSQFYLSLTVTSEGSVWVF